MSGVVWWRREWRRQHEVASAAAEEEDAERESQPQQRRSSVSPSCLQGLDPAWKGKPTSSFICCFNFPTANHGVNLFTGIIIFQILFSDNFRISSIVIFLYMLCVCSTMVVYLVSLENYAYISKQDRQMFQLVVIITKRFHCCRPQKSALYLLFVPS